VSPNRFASDRSSDSFRLSGRTSSPPSWFALFALFPILLRYETEFLFIREQRHKVFHTNTFFDRFRQFGSRVRAVGW
jgi:hypothetical protein